MPYTLNGSTRLYYETLGEGVPLMLIMGLGGTTHGWGLQVPALAPHFRVITMDNRGVGRSDAPDRPYSIEEFAEDVLSVMDAAGVERAHIMGASMGGLIAQELYHLEPRRVASLILACTGVGPADPEAVGPTEDVLEALRLDRTQESPRKVLEAMTAAFYHPGYRARIPDLVDRLLKFQEQMPQPAHAFEHQLNACYQHKPFSPRLERIRVPTLVMHGAEDQVWPVVNAERLAAGIPGARLAVIPDSAHMFMIERPREFNRIVLEFLTRTAAAETR